jgi:hypothetical protein
MKSERRRHIRVPGPFEANRVGAPESPLKISNLSEGGCFVASREDGLQPGEPCALRVTLPGGETLALAGEVLYVRPGVGFAVLFTQLQADTYTRLERAMAALRRKHS